MGQNTPFIESLKAKKQFITINEPLQIELIGNWPTPLWSHTKTIVKEDLNRFEIRIEYLGISRPGLAMQVLQPFVTIIEIRISQVGEWNIKVLGRQKYYSISVTVIRHP